MRKLFSLKDFGEWYNVEYNLRDMWCCIFIIKALLFLVFIHKNIHICFLKCVPQRIFWNWHVGVASCVCVGAILVVCVIIHCSCYCSTGTTATSNALCLISMVLTYLVTFIIPWKSKLYSESRMVKLYFFTLFCQNKELIQPSAFWPFLSTVRATKPSGFR